MNGASLQTHAHCICTCVHALVYVRACAYVVVRARACVHTRNCVMASLILTNDDAGDFRALYAAFVE